MSKEERGPFCANTACKFHKHIVYADVRWLEYINQDQICEIPTMQNSDDAVVSEFYRVSHIKRDWIYKDGLPLGKFCTECARVLLGLPKAKDGDE